MAGQYAQGRPITVKERRGGNEGSAMADNPSRIAEEVMKAVPKAQEKDQAKAPSTAPLGGTRSVVGDEHVAYQPESTKQVAIFRLRCCLLNSTAALPISDWSVGTSRLNTFPAML